MRNLGVRQQQQRQLHHAAPLDVSSWILPDPELRPLQPVRKAWSEMEKYANGESVTLLSSGRVNGFDLDALAMEERNETVDVLVR